MRRRPVREHCLMCELFASLHYAYRQAAFNRRAAQDMARERPAVAGSEAAKAVARRCSDIAQDLSRMARHPHQGQGT